MEKLPCSIFNDVLGPVMRGPSSSHVAGAARIASMIRQSLDAPVKKAIVDFDVNGALAASHTGHGTDMGFASGLLNMELDAPDVAQYEAIAKERDWRSNTGSLIMGQSIRAITGQRSGTRMEMSCTGRRSQSAAVWSRCRNTRDFRCR